MSKVTGDRTEMKVRTGATVLQACALAGKEILRFCAPGASFFDCIFGFKMLEATR